VKSVRLEGVRLIMVEMMAVIKMVARKKVVVRMMQVSCFFFFNVGLCPNFITKSNEITEFSVE